MCCVLKSERKNFHSCSCCSASFYGQAFLSPFSCVCVCVYLYVQSPKCAGQLLTLHISKICMCCCCWWCCLYIYKHICAYMGKGKKNFTEIFFFSVCCAAFFMFSVWALLENFPHVENYVYGYTYIMYIKTHLRRTWKSACLIPLPPTKIFYLSLSLALGFFCFSAWQKTFSFCIYVHEIYIYIHLRKISIRETCVDI